MFEIIINKLNSTEGNANRFFESNFIDLNIFIRMFYINYI